MSADDPIKHVVLLMMENHSFDKMLGCLTDVHSGLDGVDLQSASPRYNLDLAGNRVYQIPTDEQQMRLDPKHEAANVEVQLADGNSGFVKDFQKNLKGNTAEDRKCIMGYYLLDRLPALHTLGRQFTVCDRWFSSLPGPTWPNRFFALSGTSSGRVLMPDGRHNLREFFAQDQDTLFDRLNDKHILWRIYYYDFPCSLVLRHQWQPDNLKNYEPIAKFFGHDVLDEPTFPSFTFIEPKYFGVGQNDDHPPHNIFKAEKLIADVYNAIRSNPSLWKSTLLVIVYDEHGGFYDHVEPPAADPPDAHQEEGEFNRLGVRVPAILVSPWVGAGVDHTVFDHTSLLKYLIDKWGLGPLGNRAAAANSIGVTLNQSHPREDTVPFIRVANADLISARPELEKAESSIHHKAIFAFGDYLAEQKDAVAAAAIRGLASQAGSWVKFKTTCGKLMLRWGTTLTGDFERIRVQRVKKISDIALGKQ